MFFQRLKTHVTHSTSIAILWLSICPCAMTNKNAMSLMSLNCKSDISDIRKISTLHGERLIFSGLWYLCYECNRNYKVFFQITTKTSVVQKLCETNSFNKKSFFNSFISKSVIRKCWNKISNDRYGLNSSVVIFWYWNET